MINGRVQEPRLPSSSPLGWLLDATAQHQALQLARQLEEAAQITGLGFQQNRLLDEPHGTVKKSVKPRRLRRSKGEIRAQFMEAARSMEGLFSAPQLFHAAHSRPCGTMYRELRKLVDDGRLREVKRHGGKISWFEVVEKKV